MSENNHTNVDIQIYGPTFSNFVRSVMLICEENKISYTVGFKLDGEELTFKSEEHFDIHPYKKLPVIKHNSLILSETSSICRYLLNTFANEEVASQSYEKQAKIDAFSAIISLYIDKAIIRDYLLEFAFPKGENGEVRIDVAKNAQPAAIAALQIVEAELERGEILNGDKMTTADALLAPMLHYLYTMPSVSNLLADFPKLISYLEKLMKGTY